MNTPHVIIHGATTINIMTLSPNTLNITVQRSMKTNHTKNNDAATLGFMTQKNDTQHNSRNVDSINVMLSVPI